MRRQKIETPKDNGDKDISYELQLTFSHIEKTFCLFSSSSKAKIDKKIFALQAATK